MHVTDGILLNAKELKFKLKNENDNYIVKAEQDAAKPRTLKIRIQEYEIC